jgi:hypothetical protein
MHFKVHNRAAKHDAHRRLTCLCSQGAMERGCARHTSYMRPNVTSSCRSRARDLASNDTRRRTTTGHPILVLVTHATILVLVTHAKRRAAQAKVSVNVAIEALVTQGACMTLKTADCCSTLHLLEVIDRPHPPSKSL